MCAVQAWLPSLNYLPLSCNLTAIIEILAKYQDFEDSHILIKLIFCKGRVFFFFKEQNFFVDRTGQDRCVWGEGGERIINKKTHLHNNVFAHGTVTN